MTHGGIRAMKVKGVHKKFDKKIGAKPGDPVEFSPKEKVPLAVKDAIKLYAPKGHLCWAESVDIDKFSFNPLNDQELAKRKYSSYSFTANGKVSVRTLVTSSDKYLPAKKQNFNIKFKDVVDSMGQPDIEITEFNLN